VPLCTPLPSCTLRARAAIYIARRRPDAFTSAGLVGNEMSAGQKLTADQAHQVLERVRNEVQQQTLQELFVKISERCFDACVTKPGSKLSSSEQKCLTQCMDRYVDTMTVVSQTMQKRGEQEQ